MLWTEEDLMEKNLVFSMRGMTVLIEIIIEVAGLIGDPDHVTGEDVPAPVLVGGGGHHAARAGHAGPGQSPEMTAAADVTRSPDPDLNPRMIVAAAARNPQTLTAAPNGPPVKTNAPEAEVKIPMIKIKWRIF